MYSWEILVRVQVRLFQSEYSQVTSMSHSRVDSCRSLCSPPLCILPTALYASLSALRVNLLLFRVRVIRNLCQHRTLLSQPQALTEVDSRAHLAEEGSRACGPVHCARPEGHALDGNAARATS